jgi:hypothetical protein
MLGGSLDDDYCQECECPSCEAKRKLWFKPYVYTPVPQGFYSKSYIINEDKINEIPPKKSTK